MRAEAPHRVEAECPQNVRKITSEYILGLAGRTDGTIGCGGEQSVRGSVFGDGKAWSAVGTDENRHPALECIGVGYLGVQISFPECVTMEAVQNRSYLFPTPRPAHPSRGRGLASLWPTAHLAL